MSKLRPMNNASPGTYAPTNGTAYLMILSAVQSKRGLVHGQLHALGESCAIGSYFDVNPKLALSHELIDEVAAVNDSVPDLSIRQRKRHVARWLRWKLQTLGMSLPGRKAAKPE